LLNGENLEALLESSLYVSRLTQFLLEVQWLSHDPFD